MQIEIKSEVAVAVLEAMSHGTGLPISKCAEVLIESLAAVAKVKEREAKEQVKGMS